MDLLKNDYIFITKQGLEELEQTLDSRRGNYYRNRKAPTEASIEKWQYRQ